MSEISRIKRLLDDAKIPREVYIGSDNTADRVEWLIKRNEVNERTAKKRFDALMIVGCRAIPANKPHCKCVVHEALRGASVV